MDDTGVRVVVRPSQSSYFAGEPFSVTLTFTNTRSPDRPAPQKHHKRNAHSISSAPIARPPTSPGTPRTPRTPLPPTRDATQPARKGLIGRGRTPPPPEPTIQSPPGSLPALVEQRRKKMLAKSLSVSIAPPDFDVLPAPRSAGYPDKAAESPISPSPLSALSRRSDALALSASHPHARKHSVLDGTAAPKLEVVSVPSPLSPSPSTPSTSTFALALDSIAESSSSNQYAYPPTPRTAVAPSSPRRTHASRSVSFPHDYNPGIGLGHPSPRPFNAPPNSELLLYAYVALSGRTVLAPVGKSEPALPALRNALLRPRTRGGGSLTLQASASLSPSPASTATRRHHRSSSFSAGLRALGAGIGLLRSTSSDSEIPGLGGGAGANDDPETPLPTLDVPPEMLGVDVRLAPGEERSYTYTLPLPTHLPPTFRGRTMKFSYELVVGVCRASSSGGKNDGGANASVSRIMKVPIRIYNNVSVNRPPRPYDLLWPVARRIAAANSLPAEENVPKPVVTENAARNYSATSNSPKSSESTSIADLERYAALLRRDGPDGEEAGEGIGLGGTGGGGGGLTGCREAVEVLTRNLKKVSYDITKDGVTVAVLTFPKSAFRLGETVNGVVEVNWREGRGRVLQLTALLEAHESLPTCLAAPPSNVGAARYLRRVHAEHHARFVLGTLRLGFALDIPSDGSPAFNVVSSPVPVSVSDTANSNSTMPLGGGGRPGGLEWKVRLCLLVSVADEDADVGTEGVRLKGLVREEGQRRAWGSAWRAPGKLGVLQRMVPVPVSPSSSSPPSPPEKPTGWTAFLTASFLGGAPEGRYHDGDDLDDDEEDDDALSNNNVDGEESAYDGVKTSLAGGVGVGVRYGGKEDYVHDHGGGVGVGGVGWADVKVEMVECVVPLSVWPGNTAFRAGDVVFDV
ncbi:Rgp1-domain-containing protein [Mycena amicta]|nr:Rgp1-domain-containing protein [Mycena amicta]